MKNFFKNISRVFFNLKYRGMYAIHNGDRAGGFFVYIKEHDIGKSYALLVMPNPMESIYVDHDTIKTDLKFKDIKLVKKLPIDVYDVCKANFIYYAKKAGIYAHR